MKPKSEKQKSKIQETESQERDLSQGMGIFPDDISLTQNIGCVGGSGKKSTSKKSDSENKS